MSLDILHATYDFYNKLQHPSLSKSKKEMMCLTPCYQPGTQVRHPKTGMNISHPTKVFCATSGHYDQVHNNWSYVDECQKLTPNLYLSWYNTDIGTFIPSKITDCLVWLRQFHNIEKYSDIKQVLKNPKLDLSTRRRIKLCAETGFNQIIVYEQSDIINKYHSLAHNTWLNLYLPSIIPYLEIQKNGHILITKSKIKSMTDPKNERKIIIDYIKGNFLSKNFVERQLKKFVALTDGTYDSLNINKFQNFLREQLILEIKRTGNIL